MDISVVVATYNRRQLLEKTLPELANQDSGPYRYEVIYVIDGSTDGSKEFVHEAAARQPDRIRYFYTKPSGTPAAPRNVGIRESRGDIVLIVDDDIVPDPGLIYKHAEFHRIHPEPHHAALGEVYIPKEFLAEPISFFHERMSYEPLRGKQRLSYLDFWTSNVSVKRQFMLDNGMFDEELAAHEDIYCGYRLASGGMYLHFLPGATGRHLNSMRLKDLAAKGRKIGRGMYELEQRVPQTDLRERNGILSWDLPTSVLLRRLVNRAGLFAVGNAMSIEGLRRLAEASPKRNRVTDLYYYVVLRTNMLAAYREARRAAGK